MVYNCTPQTKEPIKLKGGGDYSLTNVKEVDGTDGFLKLDDSIKLCQDREYIEDCLAREYLKHVLTQCSCIPYQLRQFSKEVSLEGYYFHQPIFQKIIFLSTK